MGSDVIREYRPLRECTSTGSVSYGIVQPGSHVENGIPIIRVNNINDGSLDITSPLKVDPQIDEKHHKTRLEGGEVLLSLVGTTGQCVVAGPELKGWNVARAIAVIKPAQGISPEWLSICLKSQAAQHYLDSRANTTVQKTLNLQDVREIPIMAVSETEERYILEWWTTLNYKIELNRRMNATLEGMAQALFKSWFVDFDPVIDNALAAGNPIPDELAARAEVRRQALADGTANREAAKPFPASFQESESMGWIPEGWEVKSIAEVAEKIGMGPFGSRITRDNFISEGVPVIRGGNLTNGFVDKDFVYLTDDKASELKSANVFPGDIIFTHRGTIGQVGIIPKNSQHPRYVVSQSQMFLRINLQITSSAYAHNYFKSGSGMARLLGYASQVGVPAIARPTTSLKALPILIPEQGAVEAFDLLNTSYVNKNKACDEQAEVLTKLRDTLLPKLISGELSTQAKFKVHE